MSKISLIIIILLSINLFISLISFWKNKGISFLFQKTRFRKLGQSSQIRLIKQVNNAIEVLTKNKIGAIITIINKDKIDKYRTDGLEVNANISAQLIISVFQKKSPLHDGALIIDNNKIAYVGTFYKITSRSIDNKYGARHRAALWISEKTDSLTIVTSEETRAISFVKKGKIFEIKKDNFQEKLVEYLK